MPYHTTGMQQQKQQQHFYVAYFHSVQQKRERTKQQAGWAGIRVGPGKNSLTSMWYWVYRIIYVKRPGIVCSLIQRLEIDCKNTFNEVSNAIALAGGWALSES